MAENAPRWLAAVGMSGPGSIAALEGGWFPFRRPLADPGTPCVLPAVGTSRGKVTEIPWDVQRAARLALWCRSPAPVDVSVQ